MADQPARLTLMLDLAGRRCVVVGNTREAAIEAQRLAATGALVRLITGGGQVAADHQSVTVVERPFEVADLDDAWLVVAATDSPELAEVVEAEAVARHRWVRRLDRPDGGTVAIAESSSVDGVTVAVHTTGGSERDDGQMADALIACLDLSVFDADIEG